MNRCFQYCVLLALFASSNADDFDPAPTSLSIGFVLFIISVAALCYYCCRRRKVPVTFERFSNETDCQQQNQRQPPRKNKRFFGRGWNRSQTVNVVINPILPPSEVNQQTQQVSAQTQPTVPPPYDQIHNPSHPGQVYRLPQIDTNHVISPISRMYL